MTRRRKKTNETLGAAVRRRDRERDLIQELERDHGYLFSDVSREEDRHTMIFSGSRQTGKWKLTAARVLQIAAPTESWLARWANASEKAKEKTKAKASPKANPKGRRAATNGRRSVARSALDASIRSR